MKLEKKLIKGRVLSFDKIYRIKGKEEKHDRIKFVFHSEIDGKKELADWVIFYKHGKQKDYAAAILESLQPNSTIADLSELIQGKTLSEEDKKNYFLKLPSEVMMVVREYQGNTYYSVDKWLFNSMFTASKEEEAVHFLNQINHTASQIKSPPKETETEDEVAPF